MLRWILLLLLCEMSGNTARAGSLTLPDAELIFREIAVDQFTMTAAEVKNRTIIFAKQLHQKSQFTPEDFRALIYVALNFNMEEMQLLEEQHRQALALCEADQRLDASCFLLESAWQALSSDSYEEFVRPLEPYYERMTESSPRDYQLLVLIRWSTLMMSVRRYQKSLDVIQRAMRLVEAMNLPDVYHVILSNNLSLVYSAFGDYERAMEYILKTISLSEQLGYHKVTAHYYLNAANMVGRHLHEDKTIEGPRKQDMIKRMRGYIDRAEVINADGINREYVAEQKAYADFIAGDYKAARKGYATVLNFETSLENIAEIKLTLARMDLEEHFLERGLHSVDEAEAVLPKDNDTLKTLFLEVKGRLLMAAGRHAEASTMLAQLADLQERTFREQLHSKFTQNLVDSSLQFKENEARRLEQELIHAGRIKQMLILVAASFVLSLLLLLVSVRQTRRLVRQNAYISEQKDTIEQQHQRLRMIFDNVQVGILEIDREKIVRGEHSRALNALLQTEGNLSGLSLKSLLETRIGVSRQDEAMFWSSLESILGEDSSNWDMNHHHLLGEVAFGERLLHFQWQPIVTASLVTSLIVIISDVTLQKRMQVLQKVQNETAERQTRRIKELMQGSTEWALNLLQKLDSYIALLDKDVVWDQLRRHVHTLKGEARACGLKELQEACHQFEDVQDREAFRQTLQEYQQLGRFWQGAGTAPKKDLAALALPFFAEARRQIVQADCEWQGVEIRDGVGHWDEKDCQLLTLLLMHGISNAVDHGFIRPARQGIKIRAARFVLQVEQKSGRFHLQLRDNGVGIDQQKVQELARVHGFVPKSGQQWSAILFEAGISTAQDVNMTSGRGVGLNAIAAAVQERLGSVQLLDNDREEKDKEEDGGTLLDISWPDQSSSRSRYAG